MGEPGRKSVVSKIKELSSLEELRELRSEYRRKLAAIEGQLSGVVRTRLDGVKRARDLIEDSAAQIAELHGQFSKMEDLSRDCQGLFVSYPHIKSIHHARSNLGLTAHLVEYFFTMPRQVEILKEVLREQPEQLKYVYREAAKLETWRESFMAALKDYGEKAQGRATFKRSREGADPVKYQKIVELVGPQLSSVLEVSRMVREEVMTSITGQTDSLGNWLGGGCLELAVTDPRRLVQTLEVAELMYLRCQGTWGDAKERAEKEGRDLEEALAGVESGESFNSELMLALRTGLEMKVSAQFAQMQMAAVDAGESKVLATLGAASSMLLDLDSVEELVAPCFPPRYEIAQIFRSVYGGFLESLLVPLVASSDRMSEYEVRDILEAIKWLHYYNESFETKPVFVDAIVGLNEAYLGRIKGQIRDWVNNLRAQDSAPQQNEEGRWVTTVPAEMFNLISVQVRIAKALPGEFLGEVLLACLEVLHDIQADSMKVLERDWREVALREDGFQELCAVVSDNEILQEKSDEFIQDMAAGLSEEARGRLEGKMEEVSSGYVMVAVLAAELTARSILVNLEEADIVEQFFGAEWEDGSFEGMKTIVETFKDYYGDLEEWLPDFFFAKMVRASYESSIKVYVEAMLCAGKQSLVSPSVASHRVASDRQQLVEFFLSYVLPGTGSPLEEVLEQAGLRGRVDIQAASQVMVDMSCIIGSNSMDLLQVSTTQSAIKRLVAEFKSCGVSVVMHLLWMQYAWSGEELRARREFVERLARTCGNFGSEGSSRFDTPFGAGEEAPTSNPKRSERWQKAAAAIMKSAN
ncbi:unnamed protein product [Chrysoparadoxa australica]